MAVARFTLAQRQHEELAQVADQVPGLRRAARELRRAAERPGKTAELTSEELESLALLDMKQSTYVVVAAALDAARRSRERETAGAARIRARLHEIRGF